MAGKFLSLEEAARRLGVTVDEINRLVDRKELFPMRDGATIKFKVDEIERVAADLGVGAADDGDDLSLELELSSPGLADSLAGSGVSDDELVIGEPVDDESIFSADESGDATGSQTVVRAGEAASASGVFDVDDLSLESIVSASSPSLAAASDVGQADGGGSGTLAIDLTDGDIGSLAGSVPGLSSPGGSGAGGSLAAAADSGLSLEGGDLEISGIDLDAGAGGGLGGSLAGSVVEQGLGGSLAGDEFDLGTPAEDDESASVEIATEETGDSSFFANAVDDSASVSFDGSDGSAGVPLGDLGDGDLGVAAPPFTVWQVVGLVCCTLLMFLGGLVVMDVLNTIRGPQGSPLSSPFLNALAETFGW